MKKGIPSYILKSLKRDIADEQSTTRNNSKLVYEFLTAKKPYTTDPRLKNTPIYFTKENNIPRPLTDGEIEKYITKMENNKFANFTGNKTSQSKIMENKNLIKRIRNNRNIKPVRPK
tara:strand:+ start:1820 stop:2170 length:351 start_codon:yes stop_codon:yes gene_type:complete